MRRDSDVGRAGQQPSATGPGTSAGAQATGGTEAPYTTTTAAETRERGTQEPAGYGRQQPAGYARMEAAKSTYHGGLFLTIAGLLTFLAGLAFVVRHSFYHSLSGYAYNWSITSWGWVLFGLGIVTFAVGASHLLGIPMSRPLGIVLGVLTIVAGFMVLAFYPLWGIIIVALGIASVWGLAHGADVERQERDRRDYEYERAGGQPRRM